MKAIKKLIQARSDLILDPSVVGAFFGGLAWKLALTPADPSRVKRMATDGKRLLFNPQWVEETRAEEIVGAVCHEVMHVADGHIWRQDWRDMKGWNIATDRAINPPILDAGIKLPGDILFFPEDRGKSPEEIYGKMTPEEQHGGGKYGDGSDGPGDIIPLPADEAKQIEEEWKVAVVQAAMAAKSRGKLPAFIERLVSEIEHPRIDWKAALRQFMERCAKNDFSWQFPNRRYIASGIYMPCLKSEQLGPIVVLWDTSGSMDDQASRAIIAGEVMGMMGEVRPETTHVLYWDTEFCHVEEFLPGDPVEFHPKGGGGTDFTGIFDWVREQGITPACFIGISDLCATFPSEPPEYPVIWASTTREVAPIGDTIEVRL